ncbi:MAG: tetratricopeptide repeat protein [Steroidobacteraceae bacterium]
MDALIKIALQHFEAQRLHDANSVIERILSINPHHPDGLHLSGLTAGRLGDSTRAIEQIESAIAYNPDNAAYHNSLGLTYAQCKRTNYAIASFSRALSLRPGYLPALNNLAIELVNANECDQADSCYRQLLKLSPSSVRTYTNYATLLQSQRRLADAEECYQRALSIDPLNLHAHSGLMLNAVYRPDSSPCDVLALGRRLAEPHERSLADFRRPHVNRPDPNKRIKIGYVSADFRRHSVAHFIEPILASHDHGIVEVFCYSTGQVHDVVTERLVGMADHWVAAQNFTDADLADRIRADQIDILIDLSGHSAGHRLLVFARKPAPIQITWIGFLATTGLNSMDYRFTDGLADPVGSGDDTHSEQLLRLPRTCLCYRPPLEAPSVAALPALDKGVITFGSFNAPAKHNDCVLDLWAGILCAVPQSRLMLKGRGLDKGELRIAILAALERAGVIRERVELRDYYTDETAHLNSYDHIDIALDPFPYNGVTTTCEALWMGVPVVALRGDRHSARMCASLLTNAGLKECVADSYEEYKSVAVSLAKNLQHLEKLRQNLRSRLRSSALMDEIGVTREIEAAYRAVWRTWCRKSVTGSAISLMNGNKNTGT